MAAAAQVATAASAPTLDGMDTDLRSGIASAPPASPTSSKPDIHRQHSMPNMNDPLFQLDSRDLRHLFDESASEVSSTASFSVPPSPATSDAQDLPGPALDFAQLNVYGNDGSQLAPQMIPRTTHSPFGSRPQYGAIPMPPPGPWYQMPPYPGMQSYESHMQVIGPDGQPVDLDPTPTAPGWHQQPVHWLPAQHSQIDPTVFQGAPQYYEEPYALRGSRPTPGQYTDYQGEAQESMTDEEDRQPSNADWAYRPRRAGSDDEYVPDETDQQHDWQDDMLPPPPQPSLPQASATVVHGAAGSSQRRGRRAPIVTTSPPVHWQSQTTTATKQAAIARRKPNSVAKFKCQFCGESFTRQYNLRG